MKRKRLLLLLSTTLLEACSGVADLDNYLVRNPYAFYVTSDSIINLNRKGDKQLIRIDCDNDITWKYEATESWLTIETPSFKGAQIVSVSTSHPNNSRESREAIITFFPDFNRNDVRIVIIKQDATLGVFPRTNNYTILGIGGANNSKLVELNPNTKDFNLRSSNDWLHYAVSSDYSSISLWCDTNSPDSARHATLTFEGPDTVEVVNVEQEKRYYITDDEQIIHLSSQYINHQRPLQIHSNVPWKIGKIEGDWFLCEKNDDRILFTVLKIPDNVSDQPIVQLLSREPYEGKASHEVLVKWNSK